MMPRHALTCHIDTRLRDQTTGLSKSDGRRDGPTPRATEVAETAGRRQGRPHRPDGRGAGSSPRGMTAAPPARRRRGRGAAGR